MSLTCRHILAVAATLPAAQFAWADAWPTQPLKVVVPFPAGGSTDILGAG